jgi:hypothetical protein
MGNREQALVPFRTRSSAMKAFLLCLLPLLLASMPVSLGETTVDRGVLKMTLPDGYKHERQQGFDSVVGNIHIAKPKLNVKYDICDIGGPLKKLDELGAEERKGIIYSDEFKSEGIEYYFMAVRIIGEREKSRLFLRIPKANASFSVDLDKDSEIDPACAALRKIKFALPEQ